MGCLQCRSSEGRVQEQEGLRRSRAIPDPGAAEALLLPLLG